MYAFKAFHNDLTGRCNFQFELGKTYEEKECKCAQNGFHCAENPLCCLTYYNEKDRFFIVKVEGDVNKDGVGTRVSCTKITLVKEITILQLAVYACKYIEKNPKMPLESDYAVMDKGTCTRAFLIVRGRKPCAQGKKGSIIFFLSEDKEGEIDCIYSIEIGADGYKENTEYVLNGGKIHEKKSNK